MLPLKDKRILITGGTGSLGQVLVRRLLTGEMGQPRKITVFSRDEAKQHAMRVEYLHKRAVTDEVIYHNFEQLLEFRIGDVRDFHNVAGGPAGRRRGVQRGRAQAGADLRVSPVLGGHDQHRRP